MTTENGSGVKAAAPALQDRPITVGGKAYTLRFTTKSLAALMDRWEVATDVEVIQRIVRWQLTDTAVAIWAGLRRHHPEVTEAIIDDAIEDTGVDDLRALRIDVEATFRACWGMPAKDKDEAKGGKGKKPEAAKEPKA